MGYYSGTSFTPRNGSFPVSSTSCFSFFVSDSLTFHLPLILGLCSLLLSAPPLLSLSASLSLSF